MWRKRFAGGSCLSSRQLCGGYVFFQRTDIRLFDPDTDQVSRKSWRRARACRVAGMILRNDLSLELGAVAAMAWTSFSGSLRPVNFALQTYPSRRAHFMSASKFAPGGLLLVCGRHAEVEARKGPETRSRQTTPSRYTAVYLSPVAGQTTLFQKGRNAVASNYPSGCGLT